MTPPLRRVFPLVLMLGLAGQGLVESIFFERAVLAQTVSRVSLKLRKEPKHLDVMLAGIGNSARVVQEQSTKTSWRGEIVGSDDELVTEVVPQQVSMPEIGVASVRLSRSGSAYRLEVTTVNGKVLPKPTILATGEDLVLRFIGLTGTSIARQTGSLDLRRPGRLPQPVSAPPLRSRAVAPPLGDIAVGTMLINNRSFVKASGPPVTLTLNSAPAKDALMSLARLGGYGFVFVGENANANSDEGAAGGSDPLVTMAFKSERYDRALNSVLMASGLQGRLDGGTLLVGTALSAKSFGPQMSKVFRLNQVDVASASEYLGNLGANIQIASTSTTTSRESESSGTSSNSSESSTSTTSQISVSDSYSSGVGPLVGLVGTTDSRLNTITMIGDPALIHVAQGYLKQIDLRKRQVAVKVQILNVRLENNASIDSSFSAKIGDAFIVSQSGKAHMNFGAYKPGSPAAGTGMYDGSEYSQPGTYNSFVPKVQAQDVRPPYVTAKDVSRASVVRTFDPDTGALIGEEITYPDLLDDSGLPVYAVDPNPNSSRQLVPRVDDQGRPIYVSPNDPNKFQYPDNSFYSYIESVVVSANAKTLAQPTLLVQEGEKAVVRSGVSVITGVQKNENVNGSTSFSNTRDDAGLTVNLEVEKIDDNGFITLQLDPTIAVPIPAGVQEGVPISDLNRRELKSGRIRLRDRQTLILTGVIQEDDRRLARKWPLLGDLPLIGQLFRSSTNTRQKNELVIIVTPSILDDENGGTYGYGYRPGTTEATRLIRSGSNP